MQVPIAVLVHGLNRAEELRSAASRLPYTVTACCNYAASVSRADSFSTS